MSRVGKAPVPVPGGVSINIAPNNMVTVKGPKGELTQKVDRSISLSQEDGQIVLERPNDAKPVKALHGLYRALIANMVKGVSEGYQLQLELHGVGYKATATGQELELSVGYSHEVIFVIPEEVNVETVLTKGQPPSIILRSHDKQLVGAVAAKIRSLRKPEPTKEKVYASKVSKFLEKLVSLLRNSIRWIR